MEYLVDSFERLLLQNPNMTIIIAGDINNLNLGELLNQQSLIQLDKTSTSSDNVLDIFITNAPHYWKKVQVRKFLLRFDHDMIIAYPKDFIKAVRRDVRDHRKYDICLES